MPDVIVLTHVAFEDAGTFEDALRARGHSIRYINAVDGLESVPPDADISLLIVLGGPISANDTAIYPFLSRELTLIEKRLAAARPIIGICLGAQLIARARSARVYPGNREIGWAPVSPTDKGAQSSLSHLAENNAPVLHWHGETFDIPEGGTHLAYTDACAHQAFSYGAAALGLQFHPEVTASGLESWYVRHTVEIAMTPNIDVPELRGDAERFEKALRGNCNAFFPGGLTGSACRSGPKVGESTHYGS